LYVDQIEGPVYPGGDISWDEISKFIPVAKGTMVIGAVGAKFAPEIEALAEKLVKWLGPEAMKKINKYGDIILVNKKNGNGIRFDMKHPHPHKNSHGHVTENGIESSPIYPKDVPHK
jgi:hypothetical protein